MEKYCKRQANWPSPKKKTMVSPMRDSDLTTMYFLHGNVPPRGN